MKLRMSKTEFVARALLALLVIGALLAACTTDEAGLQGQENKSDAKTKFDCFVMDGATSIVTQNPYAVSGTGAITNVNGTNIPHCLITKVYLGDQGWEGKIALVKVDSKLGAALSYGDHIRLRCALDDDEKVQGVRVWEFDSCYPDDPFVGSVSAAEMQSLLAGHRKGE